MWDSAQRQLYPLFRFCNKYFNKVILQIHIFYVANFTNWTLVSLFVTEATRTSVTTGSKRGSYRLNVNPTPDYKDQKIETEKTKTYNTPFLSLKRPDFKYVIFKIIEVSPRNPSAKQHSRFGPIPPNVGRIGCTA